MPPGYNIFEADIEQLSTALESGSITCVDLIAKFLLRIAKYDCRNTTLNSVPLINEKVFEDAAEADDRRAIGQSRGLLDGIPYTVKDSYKVKGMTVASGSEAFQDLVANEDAFVVGALRNAGAILIGKTNMCPMAYGGMIRGLYGRAESPYNPEYLPAAFGSGSSNGSGVATASSFAAFGMGEETVSSGRSPASNNGLVAYTPSRGFISIRGNWPLYPTCDVIVPHTRTMNDLLLLLNTITAEDPITSGDFWRDQPFIACPKGWPERPKNFTAVKDDDHLKGKRIAVPRIYIDHCSNGPFVSSSISELWSSTRAIIEATGAAIEIIDDFPALSAYESPQSQTDSGPHLPEDWNSTERGHLIAQAWEDFLFSNAFPTISSVADVPPAKIFPHLPPTDPQIRFTEPANAIKWSKLASYVATEASTRASKSPIYDIPQLEAALHALETMRKHYFEDWLSVNNFDYMAFPAAGDVAKADSDINVDSAEHAWRNGVKYSHGNRMLRHLGIPSITVPAGTLGGSEMPMGLTFLGKGGDDANLLKVGWCFEQQMQKQSRYRPAPMRTPPLESDTLPDKFHGDSIAVKGSRIKLDVSKCHVAFEMTNDTLLNVVTEGSMTVPQDSNEDSTSTSDPRIEVFIDGNPVPPSKISVSLKSADGTHATILQFVCSHLVSRPPAQDARNTVVGKIARDSTMIMILARNGDHGRPSGFLKLVHQSEVT